MGAAKALKVKVLRAMAEVCRYRQGVNQIQAQVSTIHYESLCRFLLDEWHRLTLSKMQRRDSLLQRQHTF